MDAVPNYGLLDRIEEAVAEFWQHDGSISPADLEGLDAFHTGGRTATRSLAERAGLKPGALILDLGCGLGGPARWVTEQYAARVVGVDRSLEMVRAGAYLNQILESLHGPRFVAADATNLPFAPNSFDFIWLQHILANVEDKQSLMAGLARLLSFQGKLAMHEVVAVQGEDLDFPLPWAGSPGESYLIDEKALLGMMARGGFLLESLVDWTRPAVEWFDAPRPGAWRQLNLKLVLGDEAGPRARNLAAGLKSGRARVIQAVFKRLKQ